MIPVHAQCLARAPHLRAIVITVIISTISPGTSAFQTVSLQPYPALNQIQTGTTQTCKSKPHSWGAAGATQTERSTHCTQVPTPG